jgi:alpha-ribazole phosphatase
MRLYLIRHPQPEVAPGICYGSTDLAVSANEHARVLAALVPKLPRAIPIFSSPLRRCSELAALFAASLGCSAVEHDPRLVEMHFGAWEMRAWTDIPRAEIDAWTQNLTGYRPGGGETVLEMARRVHAFHADLHRRKLDAAIVICHAGTLRLLSRCVQGEGPDAMAQAAASGKHRIAYGELLVFDCQSDNSAQ